MEMSEVGDPGELEDAATPSDFFDHIPSKQEKFEVRSLGVLISPQQRAT